MFGKIFDMFNFSGMDELQAGHIFNSKAIPDNLKGVFYPMAEEMLQL